MHRFIPSSGDALIAQEKLSPNEGTNQNDIRVKPALLQPKCTLFDKSGSRFSLELRSFRAKLKYVCAPLGWFMYRRSKKPIHG